MPDNLASLFDLLVYGAPGVLLVVSLAVAWEPSVLQKEQRRLGFGEYALAALGSVVLGVVSLRASWFTVDVAEWYFVRVGQGEGTGRILHDIVQSYPGVDAIRAQMATLVGAPVDDNPRLYLLAKELLAQEASQSAFAAGRLMGLSLMCRSFLIAVPAAAVLVTLRLQVEAGSRTWEWIRAKGLLGVTRLLPRSRKKKNGGDPASGGSEPLITARAVELWRSLLVATIVVTACEFVFAKAFLAYWTASVRHVLRAFEVWASLSPS